MWDVRCVKPLDPAMIADAAGHPAVVTIEDGFADGGAGAAMATAVGRRRARRRTPRPAGLGPRRAVHLPAPRQARPTSSPPSASTPTAWWRRAAACSPSADCWLRSLRSLGPSGAVSGRLTAAWASPPGRLDPHVFTSRFGQRGPVCA